MTISSETRKAGPFLGTGAISEYPFNFAVFTDSDLLLVSADDNGADTTLVLGTDYTVSLNADQDSSPGGEITLTAPLPLDHLLVITSEVEALQPVDLTNQGGFYPSVVNAALDRLTILIQQINEQIGRSLKVSITSSDEATPDALVSTINAAVLVATESADTAAAAAAAAALFDPANFVLKAGGAMTGDLRIPSLNGGQIAGHRNRLLNGDWSQNVRTASSFADGAYCMDNWYALTESGNVTRTQLTDPESGAINGIRLTQPDASPKRMGFGQVIESRSIRQFASRAMHLAARLRLSTGANVRYAVLEHTGTADAVTRDVVNNWASATFTPSNFFISGVNVISTGTIAPGAATWGEVSDWDALGASVKNVIVFVWTESQVAQNVTLDCSRIQYEPGVIATPHEWRHDEARLTSRFVRLNSTGIGASTTTTQVSGCVIPFDVPMAGAPAVTLQNGTGCIFDPGVAVRNASAIAGASLSGRGVYVDLTVAATSNNKPHVLLSGAILISAEL